MSTSDREWDRINLAVADWRARLSGDDSPPTRAAFEAWLDQDPAHREANAAFEAIEEKAQRTTLPIPQLHLPQPIWRPAKPAAWMAVAAVLVLMAALAVNLHHGPITQHPGQQYAADTAIRSYSLEGGADLILDAHSLVRTSDDKDDAALIFVSGRARFNAPYSVPATFSVSLQPLRIRARGATFDVQRSGQTVRVVDVAGRVDIEQGQEVGANAFHLTPGDAYVRDAQGERVVTASRDETRWTTAMLPLDGLTLGEVVAIGNKAGGTPILLGDPKLQGMQLQGRLAAVDTQALAQQLSAAFDLDLARDARGFVLNRKK